MRKSVPFFSYLVGTILLVVAARSGYAGDWITVDTLVRPRFDHSATLLSNGDVLIAGGMYVGMEEAYLASAEIFRPTTKTFEPGPTMNVAHGGHAAVALDNGDVLFVGGAALAEIYDDDLARFEVVGSFDAARVAAAKLNSGEVLVAGGFTPHEPAAWVNSRAAFIFDPAIRAFRSIASLQFVAGPAAAVTLLDGRVLVVGYSGVGELYDPRLGTFSPTRTPRLTTLGLSMTLLADGRVLLIGTGGAEIFDPQTDSFALLPGSAAISWRAVATLTADSRVLISGGCCEPYYEAKRDTFLLDPDSNQVTPLSPMNAGRYAHTLTILRDGGILAAGGGRSVISNTVAIEAPAELYFTSSRKRPARRSHPITFRETDIEASGSVNSATRTPK